MNVLITRPRSQSSGFGSALAAAGFTPVYFPVIDIRPVEDRAPLDRALSQLGSYQWVVFTSVNGVAVVFERGFMKHWRKTRAAGERLPKIAAIGPKTAAALAEQGISPDFVPPEFIAEAILPGLGELSSCRVLLPRAEIARKTLPDAIRAAGGSVDEIAVYHTLPAVPDPAGWAALQAGVDWITFTSPSTVHNFVEIVRRDGLNPLSLPGNPRIACIGPITAQAAHEEGFAVGIVAEEYTTEGLLEAIQQPDL